MSVIAVYPGTFDPVTNGHSDLVARASGLFDKVIVAIAASPSKAPLLDLEHRIQLAEQVLAKHNNIEICGFSELLVDFVPRNWGATTIRSTSPSSMSARWNDWSWRRIYDGPSTTANSSCSISRSTTSRLVKCAGSKPWYAGSKGT